MLTILAGGRALFGWGRPGAVVPFVLWFNVLWALPMSPRASGWAPPLALTIFAAALLVLLAFCTSPADAPRARTVGAMLLRSALRGVIARLAYRRAG